MARGQGANMERPGGSEAQLIREPGRAWLSEPAVMVAEADGSENRPYLETYFTSPSPSPGSSPYVISLLHLCTGRRPICTFAPTVGGLTGRLG